MGLLCSDASSLAGRLGSRGAALAIISGLHLAAAAALLHMDVRPAEPEPLHTIQAVLLTADQPQETRPQLEVELKLPDIELPQVRVQAKWAPPPAALQAPVTHEPARPAVPQAAPAAGTEALVELEAADYLERVEPRYPPAARRARVQGTVYLRVIIGTDGRPREVRVERSSGHEVLDAAARAAVEKWLFRPYRENGVARMATVIVPVEFSISSRRG